jgi:hypothetical protein
MLAVFLSRRIHVDGNLYETGRNVMPLPLWCNHILMLAARTLLSGKSYFRIAPSGHVSAESRNHSGKCNYDKSIVVLSTVRASGSRRVFAGSQVLYRPAPLQHATLTLTYGQAVLIDFTPFRLCLKSKARAFKHTKQGWTRVRHIWAWAHVLKILVCFANFHHLLLFMLIRCCYKNIVSYSHYPVWRRVRMLPP